MDTRRKSWEGSLCWHCRKAGIECEKPVKGWEAEYKPIKSIDYEDIPSWFVHSCPEFERDRRELTMSDYLLEYKRQKKRPAKRTSLPPNTKYFDIFGERMTVTQISRRYDVNRNTFFTRLRRGMTPEQAALGQRYILIGSNQTTGEIRQWNSISAACHDGLGFNPPGIYAAIKHNTHHKGWIFEKKPI